MANERIFRLFIIHFVTSLLFLLAQADMKDDKGRQTFVVRYKIGEQTIPVTVVLDFKKQTEYVINMNPRSPAKSVTLYDFKQRTIAFKDLTNRECFLGRLTHETLNHEREVLSDVKNPVESQPKLLSLDPARSALTPTEIRNIAGQKTAVFCRKMNTWLLKQVPAHRLKKRDLDEIEERTYGHHGFHTVHYAHYGHETRRRYRNPSRFRTGSHSQKNKGPAINSSQDSRTTAFDYHAPQLKISSQFYLPTFDSDRSPVTNDSNVFVHEYTYNSRDFPSKVHSFPGTKASSLMKGDDDGDDNKVHASVDSGLNTDKIKENLSPFYDSPVISNHPTHVKYHNTDESLINHPAHASLTRNVQSNTFSGNREQDHEFISNEIENKFSTLAKLKPKQYLSKLIRDDTDVFTTDSALHSRTVRDSGTNNFSTPFPNYIEGESSNERYPTHESFPSYHKLLTRESLIGKDSSNLNLDFDHATRYGSRELEAESPEGESVLVDRDYNSREPLINFVTTTQVPHDPDVSINVLEIPRITSKFETLHAKDIPSSYDIRISPKTNSPSEHQPVVQHEYFDGLFFSKENENANNDGLLNSRHLSQQEIRSHKSNLDKKSSNNSSKVYVTPTSAYDHNLKQVSTSSINTSFPQPVLEISGESRVNKGLVVSFGTLKSNISTGNFAVQGNTFYDETDLGLIPKEYLTTESPNLNLKKLNHRSDIPSVDQETTGEGYWKKEKYPLLGIFLNESISPDQERYQNVLRLFKPDEIVIDVENIPTPPSYSEDRTLAFQTKLSTNIPDSPFYGRSDIVAGHRIEQSAATTISNVFQHTTRRPGRRVNHSLQRPAGARFHARKNAMIQHHFINRSRNFHQRQFYPRHQAPNQQDYRGRILQPQSFDAQLSFKRHHALQPPADDRRFLHHGYDINALPPGVSMHPRHPQAPYAYMVHSNRPPPLSQDTTDRSRGHRQRHHRKKEYHPNSCCRNARKMGITSACCLGSHHRRQIRMKTPCCPSINSMQNHYVPKASHHHSMESSRSQALQIAPDDSRERCQKEKMCRTLYESTQQVMVCRNADIAGC